MPPSAPERHGRCRCRRADRAGDAAGPARRSDTLDARARPSYRPRTRNASSACAPRGSETHAPGSARDPRGREGKQRDGALVYQQRERRPVAEPPASAVAGRRALSAAYSTPAPIAIVHCSTVAARAHVECAHAECAHAERATHATWSSSSSVACVTPPSTRWPTSPRTCVCHGYSVGPPARPSAGTTPSSTARKSPRP